MLQINLTKNLSFGRLLLLILTLYSVDIFAQDIPKDNLELWLKPNVVRTHDDVDVGNADTDIITTSGIVTTWKDRSGNGRDATNPNATYPVSISGTAVNGYNAVDFSAGGHEGLSFGDINLSGDYQVYIVMKANTVNAGFFLGGDGGSNRSLWGYWEDNLYIRGINGTSGQEDQLPWSFDADFGLISTYRNSSNSVNYIGNGGEKNNLISNTGYTQDHIIGKIGSTNNNSHTFDGEVMEVIVYSNDDPYTRLRVNDYLTAKYGISHEELSETDGLTAAYSTHNQNMRLYGHDNSTDFIPQRIVSSPLEIENYTSGSNDTDRLLIGESDEAGQTFNNSPDGSGLRVWNKKFYIEKTGTASVRLKFNVKSYVGNRDASLSEYKLVYSADNASAYTEVAGVTATFDGSDYVYFDLDDADFDGNGYYTITDQAPIAYYARISGDWESADTGIWTQDPSGDPDGTSTIPSSTDDVVILDNVDLTISSNNIQAASVTISDYGTLLVGSTTGHTLGEVSGRGKVIMEGDNFPSAANSQTATGFLSENGGTVEISGTGTTLTNSLPYNNLVINTSGTVILDSDLTVISSLEVENGTFELGQSDGTNTSRDLMLNGDLIIGGSGTFTVGTDNVIHDVTIGGDINNSGDLSFTTRRNNETFKSTAYLNQLNTFYTTDAGGQYAIVEFNAADKDQYVVSNGPTRFYQIVMNKGTSDNYVLNFDASTQQNCEFLGHNNQNNFVGNTSGGSMTTDNGMFVLQYGTIRFGDNIFIYQYTSRERNYDLAEENRIWIDGTSEVYFPAQYLMVNGSIKVSGSGKLVIGSDYEGNISTRGSSITLREQGFFVQEGGEVYLNQFKTSNAGTQHKGALSISGGTMEIFGIEDTNDEAASLSLPYSENSISMTDGTLILHNQDAELNMDLLTLGMDDGYHNIVGGEIIFDINTDKNTTFVSNVPLYNLSIRSSFPSRTVSIATKNIKLINQTINATDLELANDLLVYEDAQISSGSNDIIIGGNVTLYDNSNLTIGGSNTLTFNGTDNNFIDVQDPDVAFNVDNLVINLANADDTFYLKSSGSGVADENVRLSIASSFSLTQGTFEYDNYGVEIQGSIHNGGAIGTSTSVGFVKLNGSSTQSISAGFDLVANQIADLTQGYFKHLWINNTNGVDLSNVIYADQLTWEEGIINANEFGVVVGESGLVNNGSSFGTSKYLLGTETASDGGLTYSIYQNGTYVFPLGTSSLYTPAQATVTGYNETGYLQVATNNDNISSFTEDVVGDLLNYAWKTTVHEYSSDANKPQITYQFTYNETHVSGTEANYVPGRVKLEGDYAREDVGDINAVDDATNVITTTASIPYTAYYTAGESALFENELTVYYSFQGQAYNNGNSAQNVSVERTVSWGETTRWTTNADWQNTGSPFESQGTPSAGDVVVIGYGSFDGSTFSGTKGHRVVINSDIEVGVIQFVSHETATLEGADLARVRIESNTLTVDVIEDIGSIRIHNGATLNAEDMNDFLSEERSEIMLQSNGSDFTIPIFPKYPSVRLWGNEEYSNFFQFDPSVTDVIEIKSLMIDGTNLSLDKSLDIQNNLNIGGYRRANLNIDSSTPITVSCKNLNFENTISNDQSIANTFNVNGEDDAIHNLVVSGNISIPEKDDSESGQGNIVFNLFNAADKNRMILELQGDTNGSFTNFYSGTVTPALYKINMNKGNNSTSTFTIDTEFTLPTASDEELITFSNGTLVLNNSNINITPFNSTAGTSWVLPSTSGFTLQDGVVNVTGSDASLLLGGKLLMDGGTLNMNSAATPIIYSVSGELEVNEGTLNVGAEIRRSESADGAELTYTQTGGTVNVGVVGNPASASRGVLEIIGTNSEFTHTGGEINVYRGKVDIDAGNSTTNADGILKIGNSAVSSQNITLQVNNEIGTLEIVSAGQANTTLDVNALVLNGDLTVGTNTSLDFNNLDLTIQGDLTNNGTITATNSKFNFTGAENQSIAGTQEITVEDLNIETSNVSTVTLFNNFNVSNQFDLAAGVLDDGGYTLNVGGDTNISGTHTSTSSGRIKLSGSGVQSLQIGGSIGRLEIDNFDGVALANNLNLVADEIVFTEGILDIGGYLLNLGSTVVLTANDADNQFDNNLMIRMDGSNADQGITYNFPNGSLSNQIIPIGYADGGNNIYAPITFDGTFVNSTVNINAVRGINTVPANQGNNDYALDQYWDLDFSVTSGYTGATVEFEYDETKVQIGGAITEADYIGIIIEGDGSIRKGIEKEINHSTNIFSVDLSSEVISGAYYAGDDESTPDNIRIFELIGGNGDLNNMANWRYSDNQGGTWTNPANTVPEAGTIIQIPDGLILSSSATGDLGFVTYYKIIIDGTFDVNAGDNQIKINAIEGNGELMFHYNNSETGAMPNADWTTFFADGGTVTIEGDATTQTINIDGIVIDNKIQLGSLNLIGSGTNQTWEINSGLNLSGDLTVDGLSFTLNNDSDMTNLIIEEDGDLTSASNTIVTGYIDIKDNGSLTVDNNTMEVRGNSTISGDVLIQNFGVFDVENLTINNTANFEIKTGRNLQVGGDFIDNGSTTFVMESGATITFDGTSGDQAFNGQFNGAKTLANVIIENYTGDIVTDGQQKVISDLTLTTALNNSANGDETLVIANDGSLSGSSYVLGPLSAYLDHTTDDQLKFLVGASGRQIPIQVQFTDKVDLLGLDVKLWTVEYLTPGDILDVTNIDPDLPDGTIGEISAGHQWRVTDISTGDASAQSTANVTLFYGDLGGVDTSLDLLLASWDDNADQDWTTNGTFISKNSEGVTTNGVSFSEKYLAIATSTEFTDELDDAVTELPVELISFEAEIEEESVHLYWATASEINNDYFEIQRSIDNKNWITIGEEEGAGNSDVTLHYNFIDEEAVQGQISYYRLIQYDFDGAFEIIEPIAVYLDGANDIEPDVTLYPNPTQGANLNVVLKSWNKSAEIEMYNTLGYKVKTTEWELGDNPVVELSLDNLPRGVYIIRVISGRSIVSKRVIVE